MKLNDKQKIYIHNKLDKLSKSKFRSSFHLNKKMIEYIDKNGLSKVEEHCKAFINEKLAPAYPKNDGKQTPMKNHPVFIAQHACACCCRGCLEKWHNIPKGKPLKEKEIKFINALIMEWIRNEYMERSENK